MSNYAIMRIEKRKLGSVTAIGNHHERLKEKYKSNPDIDPERTHLNYHIVEPEGRYRQLVQNRIKESGAKQRKDSIVLQDCLVTATPEWINAKSIEEQEDYFNHAYRFFAEKFGEKNIISAVIHRDEANPHMHLCFVPITEDNRLSSKSLIGGPKGLEKMQTEFYEHMAEKFPDLTRGVSKKITKRKHIPTHIYKQADELYSHYEEIVNAVNDIGLVGNAKKKEEAIALLSRYAPEMASIKQQIAPNVEYIKELEDKIDDKNEVIDRKNRIISSKDDEIETKDIKLNQYERTLQAWAKDLKRLQEIINKIPPDVLKQMKRDELARRKSERER